MNDTCTDCGERATCEYDWGAGIRRGCAAHDPLRFPFGAAMARTPSYYRTLPWPTTSTTTTVMPLSSWPPMTADGKMCTCYQTWGGPVPPPPCPVHVNAVNHLSYRSQVWC